MLRSRGTVSKNKTQTISVSTLVKKLLRVQNFLLFNDLTSQNIINIIAAHLLVWIINYEGRSDVQCRLETIKCCYN